MQREPIAGRWLSGGLLALALVIVPGADRFSSVRAAVPVLEGFHPVAIQRGSSNTVVMAGKFDPWPVEVRVDAPGLSLRAGTEKGRVAVTVASDAPVGPHLVRVFNGEGASKPRVILVTDEPQMADREPNDEFAAPQEVAVLPAAVNGRLDKVGDVDSFAVDLQAGQTLVARVEAYVLASPLDAALRLVDPRGFQLAWNHDDGRTFDPLLVFTAARGGRHIVQVMGFPYPATSEVRLHGGDACIYRLHLTTGPHVSHTKPLGVSTGGVTDLELVGWNLSPDPIRRFRYEPGSGPVEGEKAVLRIPGVSNLLKVPRGPGPETVEREPNGTFAEAGALPVPGAVTGTIGEAGDLDRFRFRARPGEKLEFAVQAAAFGFPVDAILRIEDSSGRILVQNDDGAGADPRVEFTASAEGEFVAVVGSLLRRGGTNHCYRLGVTRPEPGFKAVVAEDSVVLKPGSTNELKIAATRRNGFTNAVSLRPVGLPEGVLAEPVPVPEKGGEVVLKLVTATNAPPHSGEFRLTATVGTAEHPVVAEFTSSGENNGVPNGYRELLAASTDRLWLTVLRPAPAPTNAPAAKP